MKLPCCTAPSPSGSPSSLSSATTSTSSSRTSSPLPQTRCEKCARLCSAKAACLLTAMTALGALLLGIVGGVVLSPLMALFCIAGVLLFVVSCKFALMAVKDLEERAVFPDPLSQRLYEIALDIRRDPEAQARAAAPENTETPKTGA